MLMKPQLFFYAIVQYRDNLLSINGHKNPNKGWNTQGIQDAMRWCGNASLLLPQSSQSCHMPMRPSRRLTIFCGYRRAIGAFPHPAPTIIQPIMWHAYAIELVPDYVTWLR